MYKSNPPYVGYGIISFVIIFILSYISITYFPLIFIIVIMIISLILTLIFTYIKIFGIYQYQIKQSQIIIKLFGKVKKIINIKDIQEINLSNNYKMNNLLGFYDNTIIEIKIKPETIIYITPEKHQDFIKKVNDEIKKSSFGAKLNH